MKAQPPAQSRGWVGEGVGQEAFVFIFCSSSPHLSTHRHTHTDRHMQILRLGVSPALGWSATRALFIAVEDAAI